MNLLRNFATVGVATLASRVLGFVRDVMIAGGLGTGPVAAAFIVAFRLPNLFRRLFAEGAFNSAFIPLFAKTLEGEGRDAARRFAEEALSALLFALLLLTALAEIAAPLFVYLLAGGFAGEADKFDLTVLLTRICFPYLIFVSLLALTSGVLNGLGRFAAAAFAPTLLNVVLIVTLAAIGYFGLAGTRASGIWLSIGVAIGGVVQLGLVMIAAARERFFLRLRRPRLTPGVRRLIRLGIPGVIAGGIIQINIVIGTLIASFQEGAVPYLYYADRLYQLPLGVVGIAIGVALLPDLSRRLRAGDGEGAAHVQNRSFEFGMVLTLPATVALVVIPAPIIHVLFERGAFTPADTLATAAATAAFALGLPAFVLIKVFSPGFFAREDTRTPMLYAGASMITNVAGSLALFPFLGHIGIALASAIAGWVNAGLLYGTLARRGNWTLDATLKRRLPLILLASLVMGLAVWAAIWPLADLFTASTALPVRVALLAALVLFGAAVFFGVGHLLGGMDLRQIARLLRRRRSGV